MNCDECGKPKNDPIHAKARWENGEDDAHPFLRLGAEKAAPAAAPAVAGEKLCTVCSKPPISHRGKIGHVFTYPGYKSRAAERTQRSGSRPTRRKANGRNGAARARRSAPRSSDRQVNRAIELAGEIRELRDQLDAKVGELKELLA